MKYLQKVLHLNEVNEVLPKNGNLIKTFLLGTFGTITLDVYNLLKNDLTH